VNYGTGDFPGFSIEAWDFYDDGLLDLGTPEYVDGDMSIFKGMESSGGLTFAAYLAYPALGALTNPDAFGVADFNNDGRLDIVAMNESANMLSLLTQYIPYVTFNPPAFAFGSVDVGKSSAAKKSTVKNTGTVAVNGIVVTITGANASEFSISSNTCPATLNPRATCAISVIMSPITGGTKSAMVTLTDSAESHLGRDRRAANNHYADGYGNVQASTGQHHECPVRRHGHKREPRASLYLQHL
jgi:hypothetical protein